MADEAPPDRRGELRALALALIASLILWQVPYGAFVLYPFKVLATWMHEISHGLVMLAAGVGFDRMDVYQDGSGLAFADGNSGAIGKALIAAAGYMGTPLWGVAMLWTGQDPRGARRALAVIGALMAVTVLLFLANSFGQVAIGLTAAVTLAVALLVRGRAAVVLCNLIAAQAIVGAVVDIRVLYRPVLVVNGKVHGSDAHQMAEATFGTSDKWAIWCWATVWLVWSLALLFGALVLAQRRARNLPAAAAGVASEG